MRISDDRYNRDRLRFDLALRMMRHEARTCTIQALTGLSEDRIRKLYRAYLVQLTTGGRPRRHRGHSPRQAGIFLQSAALNFEASTLASMFCVAGLLSLRDNPQRTPPTLLTLEQTEVFCHVFENYTGLHEKPRLSFEYAWFLLSSLLKRDNLRLSICAECGRVYVDEAICVEAPDCGCGRRRGVLGQWRGHLPIRIVQCAAP